MIRRGRLVTPKHLVGIEVCKDPKLMARRQGPPSSSKRSRDEAEAYRGIEPIGRIQTAAGEALEQAKAAARQAQKGEFKPAKKPASDLHNMTTLELGTHPKPKPKRKTAPGAKARKAKRT